MRSDLRQLAGAELSADVCIVGGGAAGLALADALDGTPLEVVLLESGGVEPAAETELLNAGRSVGPGVVELAASRRRALGGTTRAWAGQCVPLDPEDFAPRPWVPDSGWPLPPAELDRHYRRAERLLHIPGAVYDERTWGPFGLAPPPWDPARLRHRVTVWPRRVDLGRLIGPRLLRSRNVHVVLHATAVELSGGGTGRMVEALRAQALGGATARLRARAYVLAAGTIENARLLLLSGGIGNDHDLVGRFFQDHPNAFAAEVRTARPRFLQDRYGLLYRRGRRYLARVSLSPEAQRRAQVLNATALLVFDFPAATAVHTARELLRTARAGHVPERLAADLGRLGRGLPALGRVAARRYLLGRSPDARPERTILHVFCEQAPNRASRVTLGEERDALGVRTAQVDWRLTELEGRTAGAMVEVAAQEFARLGIGEVAPYPWVFEEPAARTRAMRDCYHHIGTTRMSTSPAHGVVDPDCRVHGVGNLYVSGASVFPTSSWANPTLTAIALSLRLGEHLRRELAP